MNSSAFLADRDAVLIADASVVINLNASGHARRVVGSVPGRILVPANASMELAVGASFGHDDSRLLDELVAANIIGRIDLGSSALAIYESLIDGSRGQTLDDGEAATIAAALERRAVALLDEKKARRMCAELFPALDVGCTVQLLLNDAATVMLGHAAQVEAMMNALQSGRMRVPPEFVDDVVGLIGPQRAAMCPSLPRVARQTGR